MLGKALAPDAKSAVMVAHGERVLLFDSATGKLRHSLPMRGSHDTIMGTRFSPDGALIGVSVPDGTVLVWETATGKSLGAVKSEARFHYAVASSGAFVAVKDDDLRVVLCDVPTGKVRHTVPEALDAIAFSPDDRQLAVTLGNAETRDDEALGIWEVGSQEPPRRVAPLTVDLQAGEFSPDGAHFAILERGGRVRIVHLASGQETPLGDITKAADICFSPDGRRVVTSNGPAMVWDAASGRLLFRAPGATVADARISPDGRVLVTLGFDDNVTSWDLPR